MRKERFPLCWPMGFKRTDSPSSSRFSVTPSAARHGLLLELKRLGADDVIISTNIPLRKDGLPYSARSQPEDTGVAVYFRWRDRDYSFACDKWNSVPDNMHAIKKTIDAIRGLERWGVSEMLERAFSGFAALPESVSTVKDRWYSILEVNEDAGLNEISQNYKKLIGRYHPDKPNGDLQKTYLLNEAYSYAKKIKS